MRAQGRVEARMPISQCVVGRGHIARGCCLFLNLNLNSEGGACGR